MTRLARWLHRIPGAPRHTPWGTGRARAGGITGTSGPSAMLGGVLLTILFLVVGAADHARGPSAPATARDGTPVAAASPILHATVLDASSLGARAQSRGVPRLDVPGTPPSHATREAARARAATSSADAAVVAVSVAARGFDATAPPRLLA